MNSIDDDQPAFTFVSAPPRDDGVELPPTDDVDNGDPDNDDHAVIPRDLVDADEPWVI